MASQQKASTSSDTRTIDPILYQERMRADAVALRNACLGMMPRRTLSARRMLAALLGRPTYDGAEGWAGLSVAE